VAVGDIKNTLQTIRNETDGIMHDIDQALALGEQQLKASEEVAQDMEALTHTAYEVERIANFM
jgi:methyl-accepting chemotaxis protein